MTGETLLREVWDTDLPIFFEYESDPDANWMAAFTPKDPADRDAFAARWARARADPTTVKTVLYDGRVAGSILSYEEDGRTEVSYWIGREYWGQGIATMALQIFLDINRKRPIYARAAKDNLGSLRVLEKCGFTIIGEGRGYANARGAEIEEYLLQLA